MKFWKKALLTIAALTVGTSAGITSVSAASSATSFVISSATSTLLIFLSPVPVRIPELSHFS